MKFDKYYLYGAYHWKKYYNGIGAYRFHAEKVKNWIREGRTLDIGAGDGLIAFLVGAEGIDNNELAVNLAQDKGVDVKLGNAYNLDYEASVFDNVLMADVIEHLEFPKKGVVEASRVLKQGGYFYITTPPRKKKGMHDKKYHYKEYSLEELKIFMNNQDFKLVEEIENQYYRLYGKFRKR